MKQEMEIWYKVDKNSVPKRGIIKATQLEYISNKQVEAWLAINVGSVYEWWS